MISARRRDGTDSADLLAMLMGARDEETGEKMTARQLRDEVMTIFLAGHETTAVALGWTWYLLSKYPAVARRLREELADVLGGRSPTIDELPRLVCTEQVIKEAMRLYSIRPHGLSPAVQSTMTGSEVTTSQPGPSSLRARTSPTDSRRGGRTRKDSTRTASHRHASRTLSRSHISPLAVALASASGTPLRSWKCRSWSPPSRSGVVSTLSPASTRASDPR